MKSLSFNTPAWIIAGALCFATSNLFGQTNEKKAADIYFIRGCQDKKDQCLQGPLAKGTQLTSFNPETGKSCPIKLKEQVSQRVPVVNDPRGPSDYFSFEGNPVIYLGKKCTHEYWSALGKPKIRPAKLTAIKKGPLWKKLDTLIRSSSAWQPDKKISPEKTLKETTPFISDVSQVAYKGDKVFLVNYKDKKTQLPYVLKVAVIDDHAFDLVSKGIITHIQATFQLDNQNYLISSSSCSHCDAWAGFEIYRLSKSGVEPLKAVMYWGGL